MMTNKKANLSALVYNRLVNKHCLIVGVDVSKSRNTAYYTSNHVEDTTEEGEQTRVPPTARCSRRTSSRTSDRSYSK